MATTIKCPHCGESFEMSQAFKHEIEERLKTKIKEENKAEVLEVKKLLEEEKKKSENQEKKNAEFRQNEIKLREEMREKERKLDEDKKDLELTIQRKIDEERSKTEERIRKEADEAHHSLDQQKDKKLQDALKMNEELKRKLEQGSQQTQGEVLELEIEQTLKKEFLNDEIKDVPKGIRGADVVQIVNDKMGRKCGIILWESKNAKWSEPWIVKLKDDQRAAKADIAVLVSENLPEGIKNFAYRNGVWVCSRQSFVALASALRINLHEVFTAKQSAVGKNEKMEELYKYLTGTEFRHRVEGIVEVFNEVREDIEKEKRWFTSKWAKQEKSITKVMTNTIGMHGELKSVIGDSLQPISSLELESGEE